MDMINLPLALGASTAVPGELLMMDYSACENADERELVWAQQANRRSELAQIVIGVLTAERPATEDALRAAVYRAYGPALSRLENGWERRTLEDLVGDCWVLHRRAVARATEEC